VKFAYDFIEIVLSLGPVWNVGLENRGKEENRGKTQE
jgi:hypothetical protein